LEEIKSGKFNSSQNQLGIIQLSIIELFKNIEQNKNIQS
jgi:hypothetical protein